MHTLLQLAFLISILTGQGQPPSHFIESAPRVVQKYELEAEIKPVKVSTPAPGSASTSTPASAGVSGSDIASRIKRCESGGRYDAVNKSGSSASGAYQYLDSSWAGYGGYRRAKDAPAAVQDRKFQEDYARSGTRPWNASRSCWS